MKKKPEQYLSWWARVIVILLSLWMFLGSGFVAVIPFIVAYLCANKCFDLAERIDKNVSVAYILGFAFGLFGLLGYYIYYRTKKR